MNKVVLIGRLTADVEARATTTGTAVSRYRLAVDRRFKREGEQDADFIPVVTFGKAAEFAEKYFKKGMKVAVTGRIQTGSYKDKDGKTVWTTDVIAEDQDPETPLGIVMISPPPGPPDLAIRVFAPYRGHGLGTAAFSLAARYAKEQLGLENLHAGCYEGNVRSEKMLLHCGFQRFPEGDIREEHYLTGAPIWQYDYVL